MMGKAFHRNGAYDSGDIQICSLRGKDYQITDLLQ